MSAITAMLISQRQDGRRRVSTPTLQARLEGTKLMLYIQSTPVPWGGQTFPDGQVLFPVLIDLDDVRLAGGPGAEWSVAYLGPTEAFPIFDDEILGEKFIKVLLSNQHYMVMLARKSAALNGGRSPAFEVGYEYHLFPIQLGTLASVNGVVVPAYYRDPEYFPSPSPTRSEPRSWLARMVDWFTRLRTHTRNGGAA